MNVFPLQNANSSVISVTGTPSYVLPLIDTAGAVTHSFYPGLDALDITPENGDIRIMIDPSTGALAPTASKGFLIKQGATLMLRHTSLRYIKVISTSGTVSCSLQVGESEPGETTVISGGGGAITSVIPGTGATNLGKAEDAAHASGDTGVAILAKRTDTAASSAGTDGDYATVNQDSNGHLWSREGYAPNYENNTDNVAWTHNRPVSSSTGAITTDISTALEASTVSLAAPGRFYLADGYIDMTAPSGTYYVQVLNSASLPADGAVTHLVAPTQIVHSTGQPTYFSIDRTRFGRYASAGVVICLSSTQFTKTISGAYLCLSVDVI